MNRPPKTALIIESTDFCRHFLVQLLEKNGFSALVASTADDAIILLNNPSAVKPDVIFMNRNIDGLTGLQAVKAIKTNPSAGKIPVLTFSSEEGKVYADQARLLGAIGAVPTSLKHTDVEQVVAELRSFSDKMQNCHAGASHSEAETLLNNSLDNLADLAAIEIESINNDPETSYAAHNLVSEDSLQTLLKEQKEELSHWLQLSQQNLSSAIEKKLLAEIGLLKTEIETQKKKTERLKNTFIQCIFLGSALFCGSLAFLLKDSSVIF